MAMVAETARSRGGWKLPMAITTRAGIGAREVEEDSWSSTTEEVNEKRALQREVYTSASCHRISLKSQTSVSLITKNTTLRASSQSPHVKR